ncbi:MAG: HAMP domain-containing histidine kinase, partial [Bdellovibrionales bacterium]|nr:HAMP domain-containing histidine kinase [Bdellovibrionales bacterium]
MISHDLKAPIYTIKGMLNMIEEDYSELLNEDVTEALKHISRANLRLEQLVSSVLEYSRVSAQESSQEQIEAGSIIQEVATDFAPQLNETGATLLVNPPFDLILGDRLRLYQIFSNLVGNAIKYRDPERPLQICISQHPSKSTRHSIITVKDNGLGIPEDRLDDIFRPFQRAHGTHIEGSGIGLACVKKLLEKLGGEIEVRSTQGEGTEFSVRFKKPTLLD